MQLAGELSKISLPSLIQLVRNGGLTGEISLAQGTNSATIYVEQGKIIHVQSDAGSGREAFLELFLWLTGTFAFVEKEPTDIPRSFSADEPVDKLLREGVAYLEEKKYLDQLRINAQTVLKPTAAAQNAADLPELSLLLKKLDGKKTLGQALSDANLTRRQYVNALYYLLSEGLVVVCEPALQGDQVELPGWVVSRLKQDNPNLSQAIVDMVIWVDRIKCWMYQADADLERIIDELGGGASELLAQQIAEQAPGLVAQLEQAAAQQPVELLAEKNDQQAVPGLLPAAEPVAPGAAVSVEKSCDAPLDGNAGWKIAGQEESSSSSIAAQTGSDSVLPAKPVFTVARATPLPPPPGSGRASDLLAQKASELKPDLLTKPGVSPAPNLHSAPAPPPIPDSQSTSGPSLAEESLSPPAPPPIPASQLPVIQQAGIVPPEFPQQPPLLEHAAQIVVPETAPAAQLQPAPAQIPPETKTATAPDAEAPQAIPKAPWTRAAMARKPFLGNNTPKRPSRSIEF